MDVAGIEDLLRVRVDEQGGLGLLPGEGGQADADQGAAEYV